MSKEIPSFLPAPNGELHEFEIEYVVPGKSHRRLGRLVRTHCVMSKSTANALKSFDKAVPQHGKILGVKRL